MHGKLNVLSIEGLEELKLFIDKNATTFSAIAQNLNLYIAVFTRESFEAIEMVRSTNTHFIAVSSSIISKL
jgi:hypothetical protein